MADGRDTSLSLKSSTEQVESSDPEQSLTKKLNSNDKKSRFSWTGSFEELINFCCKHLNIEPSTCAITRNEQRKTIETKSLIVNFYKTGTLQIQGSDCQRAKDELRSII